MNLREATEKFEAARSAAAVPYLRRKGSRSISENHRNVILSHVRGALRHLVGGMEDRLDEVELDPFVAILADAAYDAAKEAGRARPANERASVELFLRTVLPQRDLGRHRNGTKRKAARPRVHAAWQPLYDALVQYVRDEERRKKAEGEKLVGGPRGWPSQLVAFQELAALNSVLDPADLPTAYAEVRGWAREAGWTDPQWHAALHAYRRGVDLARDRQLPKLFQRVRPGDRGLRTLPDLRERLAARGCTRDPLGMEMLEIIRCLAPKWAEALGRRLKLGEVRNRSTVWLREQVDGTSRILASLYRLGKDPAELDPYLVLWEQVEAVEDASEFDPLLSDVLGSYGGRSKVSLVRRIAQESAPRAHANSPLEVTTTHGTGSGDLVPFAGTIFRDVRNAWGITKDVYQRALEERDRGRWLRLEDEHRRTLEYLKSHNADVKLVNHIEKWHVAGFGQLVCEGLHALRRRAKSALEELDAFVERHGTSDTVRGRSLAGSADDALYDYVLVAVFLDDGLRVSNYAYARSGEHFVPEVVEDEAGTPVSFRRVETSFRGLDKPGARLKVTQDRSGKERRRERYLLPGMVDHDLLFRYWFETRPRNLVRGGVLSDVAEYDPEDDHYAVFVRTRRLPGNRAHRATKRQTWEQSAMDAGCMLPNSLADRFGKSLHWIMKEVLDTPGLPEWNTPELRSGRWRGVFGAHITRTIIAVYHGGMREDWNTATYLTNDDRETLESHYLEIAPLVDRLRRRSDSRNPHWFDSVIDQILEGHEGSDWGSFWDSFDPEKPRPPEFRGGAGE